MKKIILAGALALLLLPAVFVRPAYASNCNSVKRVFGDNYTLSSVQTLDGNLLVMGGNVTIEKDATVNCSVIVFGGNVDVAGAVGKDVVIFGGSTDLSDTAVVDGQLTTFGGSVSQAEGAQVKGGVSEGFNPGIPVRPTTPFGIFTPLVEFYRTVFKVVFSALAISVLALLVVLFWPEQTARASAAITNAPAAAGGLGLLTLIAVPVLIALTAITICLIPVSLIGALLYVTAILFGWMALGMIVGARLSAALKWQTLSPAVSAAIGTFLFTLGSNIIGLVPCIGWVVPLVLAAVGLGAVTLTRFGMRPYFSGLPTQPTPPAQ